MTTMDENALFVGDWRVSPPEDVLARGEETVRLEPKAMEVLVYLASRPDEVVSRVDLERDVWHGAVVGYDAVTSTVIKLRKALGDNAKNPRYIKTIPKRGYQLIAQVENSAGPAHTHRVGMRQEADSEPARADRRAPRLHRYLIGAGLTTAIAVVGILIWLSTGWDTDAIRDQHEAQETARVEHMAFALPDKPSIAVLPFDNLSGDAAQEYFSDGLTDNIITALSQLPEVFVIARNSTFTYKGTPVKVQQVAEDLGVRYVLQGSYQRAADRVRINAQFIDALTGLHLWAERVDWDWSDLFAVQDQITHRIVSSLSLTLSEQQEARIARRYTDNLEAYRLFLRGRESYIRFTKEDNENARVLYLQAIALDPNFARAYGGLALTHNQDFARGWTVDPVASRDSAMRFAREAVNLDPTLPQAHLSLAAVSQLFFDPEGAIEAARKAIELDPNYGDAYAWLGNAQIYLGRAREALRNVEIALRLNPLAVAGYHRTRGRALYFEDRHAEAVGSLRRALEMNPNHLGGRLYMAAALAKLGRHDDAEWEIAQLLTQNPRLSLEGFLVAAGRYIRDPSYLESLEDGLQLAGLPEHVPLSARD